MKKIGIIGGLGPESTVDYYRGIVEKFREGHNALSSPEMVLYSTNITEMLDMVAHQQWDNLVAWLLSKLEALHRAGADFAIISANTPHIVFDEVRARSPLPLLSIVEETFTQVKNLGLKKVGLFGTLFTMQTNFFQDTFSPGGISVFVPEPSEQEYIHGKLMTEIEMGIIKDDTRKGLLAIVKRLKDREGIEGLILGCTELPLILDKSEHGIPFLNTTAIHVESVVRYCQNPS